MENLLENKNDCGGGADDDAERYEEANREERQVVAEISLLAPGWSTAK